MSASENNMMIIRGYQPVDREQCIAIFRSNCPPYLDPSELNGFEHWLNGQDRGVVAYQTSVAEQYYVGEIDNKVVACGGFYFTKGEPRAGMAWGLVHRDHHKRGLGTQLFRYRLDEIRRLNPEIPVVMDTSQHTFPFFEKMGFKVTKITKDGYGEGLDRYDMIKK